MTGSIEHRILSHAQNVFMRYGVRSITMDDLAKGLGISKKTIYQHYSNKADLVFEVARAHFQEEEKTCAMAAQSAVDAIDEMVKVVMWSLEAFRTMSPNLIIEIQKYYPKAWNLFQEFRDQFILKEVRKNLQRGISEGIYRNDLDVEIVARMRISQIDMSVRQEYFPAHTFPQLDVQMQMFDLYMRGIVTETGRTLLSQYLASGAANSSSTTIPSFHTPISKSQESYESHT